MCLLYIYKSSYTRHTHPHTLLYNSAFSARKSIFTAMKNLNINLYNIFFSSSWMMWMMKKIWGAWKAIYILNTSSLVLRTLGSILFLYTKKYISEHFILIYDHKREINVGLNTHTQTKNEKDTNWMRKLMPVLQF